MRIGRFVQIRFIIEHNTSGKYKQINGEKMYTFYQSWRIVRILRTEENHLWKKCWMKRINGRITPDFVWLFFLLVELRQPISFHAQHQRREYWKEFGISFYGLLEYYPSWTMAAFDCIQVKSTAMHWIVCEIAFIVYCLAYAF